MAYRSRSDLLLFSCKKGMLRGIVITIQPILTRNKHSLPQVHPERALNIADNVNVYY